MNVEMMAYTKDGELLIEKAMRICHGGDVKDNTVNKTFVQGVIKLGHESPLEHATASFKITGVSRALTHQLVRHRLSSFTQMSQRYVKEDSFEYITPKSVVVAGLTEKYDNCMKYLQNVYNELIAAGLKREDARYVLPNACETQIFMSANLRQWRSVIKLRSDFHAQWEIRDLSDEILKQLYSVYPVVFEDLYNQYITK